MPKKPLSARSLGYGQADKRILILQLVGAHGSFSQAARVAGVSYKAAWQAIHTLTNLAGEALVDSSVGGPGGGGARLTPAGEHLLAAAEQLQAARQGVLARVNSAASPALAGPRTCGAQPVRSTVRASPCLRSTTATRTGSGVTPSPSSASTNVHAPSGAACRAARVAASEACSAASHLR